MNPKNIESVFLLGNNFDYILFKSAIAFAESGKNVWFISPEAFDKIPKNIIPPDKEILQLITFFYLKDHKDLLSHLNSIHLWHKIPEVIILSKLEIYCSIYCDNYNSLLTALIVTTLLDSTSVCAKKKEKAYLILTCAPPIKDHIDRMQIIRDMYFPHIIEKSDDDETLSKEIFEYYLNKKQVS